MGTYTPEQEWGLCLSLKQATDPSVRNVKLRQLAGISSTRIFHDVFPGARARKESKRPHGASGDTFAEQPQRGSVCSRFKIGFFLTKAVLILTIVQFRFLRRSLF